MVRLALLALLVSVLVPATASAATMPGERPGDERLAAQVGVAVDYWTARGVIGCPNGIRASFAKNLLTEDGDDFAAGHGYECEIWLDAGGARSSRLGGPRWIRVFDAAGECALVIHEVGHALGLDHATEGVMREDIAGWAPRECWTWAGSWFPRARKRPNVRVAFGTLADRRASR